MSKIDPKFINIILGFVLLYFGSKIIDKGFRIFIIIVVLHLLLSLVLGKSDKGQQIVKTLSFLKQPVIIYLLYKKGIKLAGSKALLLVVGYLLLDPVVLDKVVEFQKRVLEKTPLKDVLKLE